MTQSTPTPVPGYDPRPDPLQHFGYAHLGNSGARQMSKKFHDLAETLTNACPPGPERSVALRKLLEGKDAAVRAVMFPGS